MSAPVLPDAGTDPAGFVLAAAEMREARIGGASGGPWTAETFQGDAYGRVRVASGGEVTAWMGRANAQHIAAEANPAHALAEVAVWRGVAGRHWHDEERGECDRCRMPWPCSDLLDVVKAAQAYAGGTR